MNERAAHYRQLNEAQIRETILRLQARIRERFPDSGLSQLADELAAIASETAERVDFIQRPLWPLRIAVWVMIAALVGVIGVAVVSLSIPARLEGWTQLVQVIESSINDVVFVG